MTLGYTYGTPKHGQELTGPDYAFARAVQDNMIYRLRPENRRVTDPVFFWDPVAPGLLRAGETGSWYIIDGTATTDQPSVLPDREGRFLKHVHDVLGRVLDDQPWIDTTKQELGCEEPTTYVINQGICSPVEEEMKRLRWMPYFGMAVANAALNSYLEPSRREGHHG